MRKSKIRQNPKENFVKKIKIVIDDGCWIWTGGTTKGYGRFGIRGIGSFPAHRFSYEMFIASVPSVPANLQVLHACDNPLCVRPSHLFLGTQADNVHDCIKKGRDKHVVGEDHPNARLKSHEVVKIRALYASGSSYKAIAAIYKVSSSSIYNIVHRLQWKHI